MLSYTLKNVGNGVREIIIEGIVVGTLTRTVVEEQVEIKGTNLRRARGRMSTRYHVAIARRHFIAAPYTIASLPPTRTLVAAKMAVTYALVGLVLRG